MSEPELLRRRLVPPELGHLSLDDRVLNASDRHGERMEKDVLREKGLEVGVEVDGEVAERVD